jgi:hypothetical protein
VTLAPLGISLRPVQQRRTSRTSFHPTWIASLVLLIVLVVLYNVRTRALHRHAVYLEMWEWLWWTD